MDRRRRVVAGWGGIALLLVAVGLAAAILDPGLSNGGGTFGSPTPAASSSSSVGPGSSGDSSPSPFASGSTQPSIGSLPPVGSPGPTRRATGFGQNEEGQLAWFGEDGSIVPVAEVPGLEVRIQGGRAIYFALKGNRFGLAIGSYAGEFLPSVVTGQPDGSSAQTGGAVLAGPVVARMIADALAAIAVPADRWIVALPVDIRSLRGSLVDVSFDQFGLSPWSDTPRVHVSFTGSAPLVEIVPTNGGFHAIVEALGVTGWQVIDPIRLNLSSEQIDPNRPMNELLIYGNGATNLKTDRGVDGRVPVGTQIMAVSDEVSVSLVVAGSHADLGPDRILKVGSVPVFVAVG